MQMHSPCKIKLQQLKNSYEKSMRSMSAVTTWAFTDIRLLDQIETSVSEHLDIYVITAVFVLTFLLVLF